jgi:hypothetical protein
MSKRQFAKFPITQLEQLFDEKRVNKDVLESILGELAHRKTSRARALERRVKQTLSIDQPAESPFPIGPALYRRAADALRLRSSDWPEPKRSQAISLADAHERLAEFVEAELTGKEIVTR